MNGKGRQERIGLLLHLIDYLNKNQTDNRSGETHVQKLIYFLIRSKLTPFSYDYIIYNYGPFSFELTDDIHFLEESKMIIRKPGDDGFGFRLIPDSTNEKVNAILSKKKDAYKEIDALLNKFNSYSAKDLGLLTTFVFLKDELEMNNEVCLIETVKKLKPMFTRKELEFFYQRNKEKMNIKNLVK
jgi:uncharacterized protein YwgA